MCACLWVLWLFFYKIRTKSQRFNAPNKEKGKVLDRRSERNWARKHEGDVYFTVLLLSFLSRPYIRFHHFLLPLPADPHRESPSVFNWAVGAQYLFLKLSGAANEQCTISRRRLVQTMKTSSLIQTLYLLHFNARLIQKSDRLILFHTILSDWSDLVDIVTQPGWWNGHKLKSEG